MAKPLLESLVGDNVDLYHNNPYFRAAMQSLASSIPIWVDGLAVEAEKQAEKMALLEKHLNNGVTDA